MVRTLIAPVFVFTQAVIVVGDAPDPYRGNAPSVKVTIFMNVFNVHSQRSPVDGVIKDIVYSKGYFVNASLDKASSDNERNALVLRMDNGTELSCVQVAGLIARRILCWTKEGQEMAAGERIGMIRFGSRVDVYLPPGKHALVAVAEAAEGIRKGLRYVSADRLLPHPDCGLKTRTVEESLDKCRVVVEAAKLVRAEGAKQAVA